MFSLIWCDYDDFTSDETVVYSYMYLIKFRGLYVTTINCYNMISLFVKLNCLIICYVQNLEPDCKTWKLRTYPTIEKAKVTFH